MNLADIGILGLGTMGAAIARNAAGKKYTVAVYNRTAEKTDDFFSKHKSEGAFIPAKDLKKFIASLKRPRKILVMVTAGAGTDAAIQEMIPYLQKGDIIIDGGNAQYQDTARRIQELKTHGILFLGSGISGGEEGALRGPSLMVGGEKSAWTAVKPIFTKLAARDKKNRPCVAYIGAGGSGHYVKMVHNGIEYGIMQVIAEIYALLRDGYELNPEAIADIFESINEKQLRSFLFDTAISVLRKKDDFKPHDFLINNILSKAGQKGTGMWTSIESLERGVPTPTITEAVYARYASNRNNTYVFSKQDTTSLPPIEDIANSLHDGILSVIISTFLQGFSLIEQASKEESWNIQMAEVSRIWQNGCIIRMNLLELFETAYAKKQLKAYIALLKKGDSDMRRILCASVQSGIPTPAFSSAVMYVDILKQKRGNANMIQGMRDLFGAHTYERIDRKGVFHTDWS